jgi:chromosome segregation ATPase
MRSWLVLGLTLWLGPAACLAASKEMVQLQRDVAVVDDRVRTLQSAFDERIGALTALQQLTLDRVNQLQTSTAVFQNSLGERMTQQAKAISTPVATVGSSLNQVRSEIQSLRDSLAEVNSRLRALDQKLVELDNAVRVMQAPPAPPPPVP